MADGELSKPPTPRDNGTYTLIEKFHRKEIPICIKPTLVNLVKSQTVIQPKLTGLPPIQTSSISFADVVKGHTYQDPSVLAQSKPKESSYSTQSFASEEMVKGVSTTQMVASIETEENQFLPILELHGKPAVFFPIERKPELVDKLKYVLVGKFSHDRPLWTRLKTFFHDLKLQGAFNVSIYDNKHIFIECSCKVDFDKLWLNLSWSIDGYIMRMFKWGYDFNPMKESSIVPVWIRMVGVPLHLFDEKTLWQISNIFGKPIKVDPRNVNRSMLNHARVCVQLDIEKPLIDSCYVGFIANGTGEIVESYCVKIFYDCLPSYCSSCAHIGHKIETCKRIQTLVSTGADSDVIDLAVEQASTSMAIDHQRTGKDKCKMEVWQPVCIRKKDQKAIPAGELILDQPLARFNDLANKSDISGIKDADVSKTNGAKIDIIASQQFGGANPRSLATDQGTQNGAHVVAVKTDLSGPIVASCSAPTQAVTTVWIPVKKSITTVDLNSKHRFGSLNLQDEEVSKAIGKDPGAAQPSKTAATNVVGLDAVLRNEDENRLAVEKKCSTVTPLASEIRFVCLNLQDGEALKASDEADCDVEMDAKPYFHETSSELHKTSNTAVDCVVETEQTIQSNTATDSTENNIENGHSHQIGITDLTTTSDHDWHLVTGKRNKNTLKTQSNLKQLKVNLISNGKTSVKVPAEQMSPGVQTSTDLGHLQQGTEQTKKHKQQYQIITGCPPSWADQMEKVNMKANKVRQAETPNTLHKNSGKNNSIEHQNKAKGILGQSPSLKARFTKFGKLKYCDELELKGRSRSQPPNKVFNNKTQEYSDNDLHIDIEQPVDLLGENPMSWTQAIKDNILVARRSVPPKGRISSRLSSLEMKCDFIDFTEYRAQLWDQDNYDSKQYLLGVGGTFKVITVPTPPPPRHTNSPSRSAPGQTTRRGRGRNRGRNMKANGICHF